MKILKLIPMFLIMIFIAVSHASSDQYLLFNHSGDSDTTGICAGYVLKQAKTVDSLENNWEECSMVVDTIWNIENKPYGTLDSILIPFSTYQDGNYYFGIKGFDEKFNVALLSNVPIYEVDNTPPAPVQCNFR